MVAGVLGIAFSGRRKAEWEIAKVRQDGDVEEHKMRLDGVQDHQAVRFAASGRCLLWRRGNGHRWLGWYVEVEHELFHIHLPHQLQRSSKAQPTLVDHRQSHLPLVDGMERPLGRDQRANDPLESPWVHWGRCRRKQD